jgi:two-component system, OmpR family, sensor kinase
VRAGRRPWLGPTRLSWRIFAGGLLLLALVGVANLVVGMLLGRGQILRSPERLVRYTADQAASMLDDPGRLQAELEKLGAAFNVEMAVFLADGTRRAAAGDDPPPRPDLGKGERRSSGVVRLDDPRPTWVAPLPGQPGAVVVVATHPRSFPLSRAALFLGATLLALAVITLPGARLITRPLERVRDAARRLGAGDLSARSGIRRSDEVGELSRAFDDMADRVERLVRSERQLLADVSHELRTPLARMRVALDLAAEGDLARARTYLEEIRADADELERVVDDVLAAARLEVWAGGGEVPLRRQRVAASEVVGRAAERFRQAHPGRVLEERLEEGLPEVEADPALLRRVLDNLLDNAASYSEPPAPVVVAVARGAGGSLQVEVRDRGIGVDAADLPRVFTPFFRTDRSRARRTGGVGLGLVLAKRIVEAHRGAIAFESEAGKGTTVRFTIPAA